jgi:hypothetical protein
MEVVFGKMLEMFIVFVPRQEIIGLLHRILIVRREIIDDDKIQDNIPMVSRLSSPGIVVMYSKSSRFVGKRVTDYRADETLLIPDGIPDEIPFDRIPCFCKAVLVICCLLPE